MNVIDLPRLAVELPEGFERLRGLIDTTLDLHSAWSDLRIASDQAWQAQAMLSEQPRREGTSFQDGLLALVSSAVIYYVRATKSSSDHRRTFDIRSNLEPDERAMHERLCALRDDAVAHYGPGYLTDNVKLRSDHMVVASTGKLVAISRHTYAAPDFVASLAQQAQRAVLIMQRLFHEREALLTVELNSHVDNPKLDPAIAASTVDLGEAIGDPEMARQILDGPQVGHLRL